MNSNLKINSKNLFIILMIFFPISFVVGNLAINLITSLIIFLGLYVFDYKKINKLINYNSLFFLPLIFFLYVIINSIFINHVGQILIIKSILNLKFLLLISLTVYILSHFKISYSIFKNYFLAITLILSLSVIFQYLLFQNGIIIEYLKPGMCIMKNSTILRCERFSGLFGSEYLAGGFLSMFGVFSIYLFYKFSSYNKLNIFVISVSLILTFIAIILSGGRNGVLIFFLILSFSIILSKELRNKIILFTIISILITSFLISTSDNVKHRLIDWPSTILFKNNSNLTKGILNSPWGAHYVTAYDIYKENKFFGSGYRTFREVCSPRNEEYLNQKYNLNISIDSGCSTHPHNIYFEVISELGLFGIILFTLMLYVVLMRPLLKFKKSKKVKNWEVSVFSFILIASIFFPFKPTGSIYTTWYATFLCFFVIFHLHNITNLIERKE